MADKFEVTLNPSNPGVQEIFEALDERFPDMQDWTNEKIAQFVADFATSLAVFGQQGASAELKDLTDIMEIVYAYGEMPAGRAN